MARRSRRGGRGRYSNKATAGNDANSILDVIAVGTTQLPAYEIYWLLYQKHPWVASCVNLIANTVAGDGYSVAGALGNEDVANDSRVPQIDEFLSQGFVGKLTYRRAMFSLVVDILVFGCGYWRKKRAGRLCIGLERIDPRYVLPKPNADRTQIETFVIRKRQALGDNNATTVIGTPLFDSGEKVKPTDIVFFTLGGGDQLLGAPSPLEHLDYTIGLDLAIRKFRQSFFNNGATFGKILSNKTANEPQIRMAENMIKNRKKGPENAFSTTILAGDWGVVDKGEQSGTKDVDFVKGSGINREEICGVYHVPVGKLTFGGNALGSAGKAEDDETFQEQCVLPLEETIFEIINRDLLAFEYDIEDLKLAPRRRAAVRLDMFEAAVQGTQIGMTANEVRELVNLPPITDPEFKMDVPLFLGSKGPALSADEPLADPPALPGMGAPGNAGLEGSNDEIDDEQDDDKNGVGKKAKSRFRHYP